MTITDPTRPTPEYIAPDFTATHPEGPVELFDTVAVDRILATQTFDRETLQPDVESLNTLDLFTRTWSDRIWDRPRFSLAWPKNLYIPSDADWRKYWYTENPTDHEYDYAWTGGSPSASGGCSANKGTGEATATVSPFTLSGTSTSWASLAIDYQPTATLSQIRFSADVVGLATEKHWFLTESGYASFTYFATVFLLGWEFNPALNQWEQLPQFAKHDAIASTKYGQQGNSLTWPVSLTGGALGVNFLVEGHKRYAFGVTLQTRIIADARQRDDRTPYQRRDGDQIDMQCRLGGMVPQMTVDTTITYQA